MRPLSILAIVLLLLASTMLAVVPGENLSPVHAVPSDYAISASPSQLSLAQGASSSPTITVTAQGSYQGNVTLLLAETYDSIDISVQFTPQILQLNSTHQTVNSVAKISVSQWTVPGSYTIDVEAYDGTIQHGSQIVLTVTGQDFSISASPSRLDFPLAHNTTLNTSVTVTSIGGFSGAVSLTVSVSSNYPPVPMLPTASPTMNTVMITPSASPSFQLAIFANSSLVAHSFDIEVTGSGATTAGVSHSFGIGAVVGPDFNMSMQTRNMMVHQGSIAVSTLTFTSINGYEGSIGAYSGLIGVNPPNPDIQLYPLGPILLRSGTNSSQIVVKTDGRTGLGTYHVAIEATDDTSGGHLGEGLAYTITVAGPAAGPDFSLYADPNQISASLGTAAHSTINIIGEGGYSGSVTLLTSIGWPTSLTPTSVTLSSTANETSTLTISLPGPTPGGGGPGWWYVSGKATVIVVAADPTGLAHEASVNITATPFTFTASPTRQQLTANSNPTFNLSVGAIGGFNGTVGLTVAGSIGVIATLDNSQLNFSAMPSSLSSQLRVNVPAGTSDGDYLVQVTATYMKPEYLPFYTAPKEALAYTIPVHVIVTSPTSSPRILGLQPIEFYGIAAVVSAAAIFFSYLALRRRRKVI